MNKKWRSIVFVFFLLILIVVAFGIGNEIKENATHNMQEKRSSEVYLSPLESAINNQSKSHVNNLTGKDSTRLQNLNKSVIDKRFFGSFIGVKNDKLLFSGTNGYADSKNKVTFKANSLFLAGQYQEFLNNAMILKLVDQKRLKLSSNVYDKIICPGVPKNLTVKQLLLGKQNLYIERSKLRNADSSDLNSLSNLEFSKGKRKSRLKANNIVKAILIAKVMQKSYKDALTDLILDPLGLMYMSVSEDLHDGQANYVQSYAYHRSSGIASQEKVVNMKSIYFGVNNMRISLSDAAITYKTILSDKYFGKKYKQIFLNSIRKINGDRIYKRQGSFNYSSVSYNQAIYLVYNIKNNSVTVVGTNIPNYGFSAPLLKYELNKLIK